MNVSLYFFLDGELYASRSWRFVPRVGDEVVLGTGRKKDIEKIPFRIKRVVWGVEPCGGEVQCVNLEIEAVE